MENKSKNAAVVGLFSALVVVLQFLSYLIKIGTFNLSLVLIPIVIGAVLYGPRFGATLGSVFGVVVIIACIAGLDGGGAVLMNTSPVLTIIVCLVKGMAAGAAAGFVGKLLKNKNIYFAVFLAAITAPIVNTGLFCIAMALLFKDVLVAWAGGGNLFYYVFIGLIGVNFLIEFGVNVIFAPAITRIINAVKKI